MFPQPSLLVRLAIFGATILLCFNSSCSKGTTAASTAETPPRVKIKDPVAIGALAVNEPHTALPVEDDDARQGSAEALVTLIAFLDFQCSFCASGFETLLKLRTAYSDEELRIVFKHLPLRSHEQAIPAAIAGQTVTELAGSDAFFRFARLSFNNQSRLGYESFAKWAEEVGVPRELYNERVGSEEILRRVAQDAGLARKIGINSTPSFFVNGKLLAGNQPIEVFHEGISIELAAMKALKNKGWQEAYQERIASNMRDSLVEALLAQDPNDLLLPLDGSPVEGPPEALVTMVMFTDFECPFCKRADDTVKSLRMKYGEELRLVFKHLPLPFHQKARPAALLTAAIQEQLGDSAFFQASRAIFDISPHLDEKALRLIGRKQGLSDSQIDQALEDTSPSLEDRLERDRILGDDVLARGTPHFFINGKRLSGARPFEHFEALIEHEKKRALKLLAQGTESRELYATLQKNALSPGAPQKIEAALPEKGRPTRGSKQAKVDIHVFSDFECPYCRRGEENLAELSKRFPTELRFIWHDLPLAFHQRARPAARAARYAFQERGNNGFWAMHSALFGLNGDGVALSNDQIISHGKALGLDEKALSDAMLSDTLDVDIDADIALAESVGIHGTPAYVIGGYLVTGARPVQHLIRVVKLVLKEQTTPK